MFVARRIHRYTYADYVALELSSTTKHEFLRGSGNYADTGGYERAFAAQAAMNRASSPAHSAPYVCTSLHVKRG